MLSFLLGVIIGGSRSGRFLGLAEVSWNLSCISCTRLFFHHLLIFDSVHGPQEVRFAELTLEVFGPGEPPQARESS